MFRVGDDRKFFERHFGFSRTICVFKNCLDFEFQRENSELGDFLNNYRIFFKRHYRYVAPFVYLKTVKNFFLVL